MKPEFSVFRFQLSVFGMLLAAATGLASDEERISQRVKALRGSDTEAWRKIPWSASLLDAARAARREGRPMFLFSHEGNIDTGRC
jgi:hypothetical protein